MDKIVVGIKFRESGKVFYYEPGTVNVEPDDFVIVQTVNGEEFGSVTLGKRSIPEESPIENFSIIRKATKEDINANEKLKEKAEEAKNIFKKRVDAHNLGMKLIDVTYTFDEKKVIFYYTAEGRVDFRELVKDLAGYFHSRIELRQIGVRDEARKYGCVGVCGRKCCCSCWLSDFMPVSIKMAKDQNLSLNSTKISGICGRLLCCLKYEEDYYEEVSQKMPNIGDELMTPIGMGTVYKLNTLDQAVLMKIVNNRDEVEIKRYTLEELAEAKREQSLIEKEVEQIPEVKVNKENKLTAKSDSQKRKRARRRPFKKREINKNEKLKNSDKKEKKTTTKTKAQKSKKPRKFSNKKTRTKKRYSSRTGKKTTKTYKKARSNRRRAKHRS